MERLVELYYVKPVQDSSGDNFKLVQGEGLADAVSGTQDVSITNLRPDMLIIQEYYKDISQYFASPRSGGESDERMRIHFLHIVRVKTFRLVILESNG